MSFPSILRRQALRAFSPITKAPVAPVSRAFHGTSPVQVFEVPGLRNADFEQDGVPGLFSKKAFQTAWTDYQGMLVNKLNELTAGSEFQSYSPQEIAFLTARQPANAALFNYASQAHNNHFFFDTLSPRSTPIPPTFIEYISSNFSSPDTLREEFLTTAKSMFGNGWVWLVTDRNNNLRILCTYNAGTPYAGARRQSFDMNNTTKQDLENATYVTEQTKAAAQLPKSWTQPLLSVNVWQHAWLEDYGVAGKETYLNKWWDAIDWNVVSWRLPTAAKRNASQFTS
ncbi:hypothetical protein RUND412_006666 [Rhizina undulata]